MGVIYTGMERATELTVDKRIGGSSLEGYPRTYKVGDSFGNFSTLTKDELSQLSPDDYLNRLAGFKTYVESVETGVEINTNDAYRENLVACPIP